MYIPHRTERFHYMWDMMHFVEDNQCRSCAFSKIAVDPGNEPHSSEYPMCFEVEAEVIQEGPVEALDELPSGDVVCTKYRNIELAEQSHPDQGRLL